MNKQEHLLTILIEECNELAQQASKALRFGIDEQRDLPTSNRERLNMEYNDLMGVKELLATECEIFLQSNRLMIETKKAKVRKYMQYSKELGVLVD